MSDEPVHYAKLPGPGIGWVGRARLWLAGDHLLEVNSTFFTERYHRYFLGDIRALVAQRTKTGFYWNIALAGLGAIGLAIAGGFYWGGTKMPNAEARIVLSVFAGMAAGLAVVLFGALVFNSLLGPTCRCHIQTAAGTHLLGAPTRLRRLQRLLGQIVPHIESVQSVEHAALS